METQDLMTIGMVALIAYLLLKPKQKVEKFPLYVPTESVTSTITFGVPGQVSDRYPGYRYDQATGDYVDLATGEHLMID